LLKLLQKAKERKKKLYDLPVGGIEKLKAKKNPTCARFRVGRPCSGSLLTSTSGCATGGDF
jgi:hypothetical protein